METHLLPRRRKNREDASQINTKEMSAPFYKASVFGQIGLEAPPTLTEATEKHDTNVEH